MVNFTAYIIKLTWEASTNVYLFTFNYWNNNTSKHEVRDLDCSVTTHSVRDVHPTLDTRIHASTRRMAHVLRACESLIHHGVGSSSHIYRIYRVPHEREPNLISNAPAVTNFMIY